MSINLSIIKILRMLKIASGFTPINICLHNGTLSTHCVWPAGRELIGPASGKLVTCLEELVNKILRSMHLIWQ